MERPRTGYTTKTLTIANSMLCYTAYEDPQRILSAVRRKRTSRASRDIRTTLLIKSNHSAVEARAQTLRQTDAARLRAPSSPPPIPVGGIVVSNGKLVVVRCRSAPAGTQSEAQALYVVSHANGVVEVVRRDCLIRVRATEATEALRRECGR